MTRSDRDMIVDKIQIQIQKVALDLIRNAIEAMASCPRREAANVDRFTLLIRAPASALISPTDCSSPLSRLKGMACVWGYQSAGRSSSHMAAISSRKRIRVVARSFSSPRHLRSLVKRHDWAAHSCDRR
ncbi:hypothetical protein [Bradyrhizobium shewense]|uniref:hypothetical protein n=1 Tax=Bradyrhizobium shewense TaxID=1761772 RepID=UPI003D31386A